MLEGPPEPEALPIDQSAKILFGLESQNRQNDRPTCSPHNSSGRRLAEFHDSLKLKLTWRSFQLRLRYCKTFRVRLRRRPVRARRAAFLPDSFFLLTRHRTNSINTSVTTANIQKQSSFAACNNGYELAFLGLVIIAMWPASGYRSDETKLFSFYGNPRGDNCVCATMTRASSVPH